MRSNARCIWPSQRMAWWMRPGPSRFCAIRKPSPRSPSMFAAGTRTPGSAPRSACSSRGPRDRTPAIRRTTSTPGVSAGTMIARCAPVRRGVGVGDGHDDAERGSVGAGREPLVAVDHPRVAVAAPRASRGWSGRRPRRAARSSRRTSAPRRATSGASHCSPLLRRAEHRQDLAVAGVGRLAAEDRAGPSSCGRSARSGRRRRGSRGRVPPASGPMCGAHRPSARPGRAARR